ncbi:xanthine dehydrogenase family protein subunit M [Streptomyces sp. NBC_01260]|uniref:FAD binding domain-containing protein n=1 Tax=unclassified Streptomyces TaxID=2593676 RepID=UPI000F46A86D|nr:MULTISPECIES: xanthine dehydrogenase family protein subunit M [unclassified Streptomyces]MCX4768266.1 xanthine dehydrogenase family protein subunit M [Streptomyces sp. NBC_01285]ROQ77606.1 xanthine dehydrogenase YagS FAD-binding subunit [Streptomyces sp. CEV 2-1]RPK39194.1 4-hydroxybenzoyl-CoA reductase subunit beta [Streptomyces sp. ADI92-24]
MRSFSYGRARSLEEALTLAQRTDVTLLAGGTELLNWARIGIHRPERVLDISRVPGLTGITALESGGLRIGALTSLNAVALHAEVRERYPVLSQAIVQSASAQLRNLATIGGNPVQRTRCAYFRSDLPVPCNKREPGSGCAALNGINARHAIFGWTEQCVATHPSDPAVALSCLDAVYVTEHVEGGRRLPAKDFHVLPAEDPCAHNVLRHGEVITAIEVGPSAPRSAYVKVRERQSYEFALTSAAAVAEVRDEVITRARIALGGVAMRPWRLEQAEVSLVGLTVGSAQVKVAITSAFDDARALSSNAFKIPLSRNTALRAFQLAARVR